MYLVVFDKAAFDVSEKLLGEVASYIHAHYVEKRKDTRRELLDVERKALDEAELIQNNAPMPKMAESRLEAPAQGLTI